MEDIIYWLLMAAVMIGGAVSSSNKKKKQREAAARKAAQQASGENPEPEKRFVRKSLSDILEELANQQEQTPMPEIAEEHDDYYSREVFVQEEGGRVTEEPVEKYTQPNRSRVVETVDRPSTESPLIETHQEKANSLAEILGEEFDLRRAVIESEILKPKFEQY